MLGHYSMKENKAKNFVVILNSITIVVTMTFAFNCLQTNILTCVANYEFNNLVNLVRFPWTQAVGMHDRVLYSTP